MAFAGAPFIARCEQNVAKDVDALLDARHAAEHHAPP
jgi:hypothetical protein